MRKFWEGQSCVLYHIDRIESRYGNICIRGWVSDLDPEERTECSVVDADGVTLPVYMERADIRPEAGMEAQKGKKRCEADVRTADASGRAGL